MWHDDYVWWQLHIIICLQWRVEIPFSCLPLNNNVLTNCWILTKWDKCKHLRESNVRGDPCLFFSSYSSWAWLDTPRFTFMWLLAQSCECQSTYTHWKTQIRPWTFTMLLRSMSILFFHLIWIYDYWAPSWEALSTVILRTNYPWINSIWKHVLMSHGLWQIIGNRMVVRNINY